MNRIFKALMGWTVVTTAVLWLTLVRSVLVPSWQWSLFGLKGAGLGGDLWVVFLLAVFSALLLWLGWRGKQAPFHLMLLLWHWTIASVATTVAIRQFIDGSQRGSVTETGVLWPLGALATTLLSCAAVCAVWVAIDLHRSRQRPLSAPELRPVFRLPVQELLIVAALLPVAFLLYHLGRDGLGVSLANLALILQWVLLVGVVLRGREPLSRSAERRPLSALDVGDKPVPTSSRFRSR